MLADGRMFEVKRLYIERGGMKKKILFGPKQFQRLQELGNVDVLVFLEDKNEPVEVIPSKAINENMNEWNGIALYRWNPSTSKLTVTLTGNLKEALIKKATEKFGDRKTAVSLYVEMLLRRGIESGK